MLDATRPASGHGPSARIVGALLLIALGFGAQPARTEETARQILDRQEALNDTTWRWKERHQKMRLTVVDLRGGTRQRELEIFDRKPSTDEQKTIAFFLTPAEVRGTGLLAFSHRGRPADQWLYLPELSRVRQISARLRNERFVGTDLTYRDLDILADMPSWSEQDARSRLRGTDTVADVPSHVIELVPQRDDIGYGRLALWLGREDLVVRRIEFYEAEGDVEPARRMTQSDIRLVGTVPVAYHAEVETPKAGTHTAVEVLEITFDQGLDDSLFTQRSLERGAP